MGRSSDTTKIALVSFTFVGRPCSHLVGLCGYSRYQLLDATVFEFIQKDGEFSYRLLDIFAENTESRIVGLLVGLLKEKMREVAKRGHYRLRGRMEEVITAIQN